MRIVYVILNQQYVPFHEYLVSSIEVFFWFLSTYRPIHPSRVLSYCCIQVWVTLSNVIRSLDPLRRVSVVESEVSTRIPNQHQ